MIGGDAVLALLTLTEERADKIDRPLDSAGVYVRDRSVRRIKMGGDPPWPPAKYPQDHRLGVDSGVMWRSITMETIGPRSRRVGTNVKYAKYFQEGTGQFAGRSGWVQQAQAGSAIAFTLGGKTFLRRSVAHIGQPPRPFLYVDDKDRVAIQAIFARWLREGQAA